VAEAGRLLSVSAALPEAAALLGAAALFLLHRYERRAKKRQRARFFADCLGLLRTYKVTQEDVDYPVVTGTYRGYAVRLEPVIDHMAWRKLPVLWLKVTVLTDIPYGGVLDLLIRPHGAENFTANPELEYSVKLPEDWPQDGVLCTDDPETMPPLELIAPRLGIFADDRLKELVITPRGVRLVARMWQAVRANYVTFREIKFPAEQADAELVRRLLDTAIGMAECLKSARLDKVA
jgi:hypothetical protein